MLDRSTPVSFRIYVLLITIIASGFFYGCEKPPLEAPLSGHNSFDALRTAFATAGYEKGLIQNFNDTAKIYWQPNWQAGYNKTDAKGLTYTYVPLTPLLRSTKEPHRDSPFKMLGVRRFILIKRAKPADSFSLATYVAATPQKQPAAVAAEKPFLFSTFSGVLLLQELSTDGHARLVYQHGIVVAQTAKPLAAAKGSTANRPSSYECVYYYTCYWYATCTDRYNNHVTYGTMTGGIDGCSEPGFEACSENWGMSWNANGQDIDAQCTYVEDPPNPDDPPGGGGGGGGDDDGGPFDPGIFTTEPATADPDLPSDCSSWQFQRVGPSGYMACGVTGIEIDLLSQFQNADGSSSVALNVYRANLFFEMPARYTPGEAATICAQIKDDVEEFLEDLYRNQSPPQMAQSINSTFIREMRSRVASVGGRVTQTAQYPNTPVGPYGHTFLPNNGGCM